MAKKEKDDLKRYFKSKQAAEFMGVPQSTLNTNFNYWEALGLLSDVRIQPKIPNGKSGRGRPGFQRLYSEDDCRRVRDYVSVPLNNGGILDAIRC